MRGMGSKEDFCKMGTTCYREQKLIVRRQDKFAGIRS